MSESKSIYIKSAGDSADRIAEAPHDVGEVNFMLIFGNSQRYPDDSAESFITQNLSPYCVLWLSRQSEALGQTRTVILQHILKEWLTTHAGDVPEAVDVDVPEVAREAVAEFIVRHHEEFLPIGGEVEEGER